MAAFGNGDDYGGDIGDDGDNDLSLIRGRAQGECLLVERGGSCVCFSSLPPPLFILRRGVSISFST